MKEAPLISLDRVGVCYPQRTTGKKRSVSWALSDIGFQIAKGETLGVVGRNGAGKTTLLRLLAGIITPDRGSIQFAPGLRPALLSLQAGFIFQLSGRQNVVLSALALGLSHADAVASMPAMVEFSELGDFIDRPVSTYSTGMRARLGFSVAMHVVPDVLLIDEVLSVGDEGFKRKSSKVIQERVTSNTTTVLVTHQGQLARGLCTRMIWIADGSVKMSGSVDEVLPHYQETYVPE